MKTRASLLITLLIPGLVAFSQAFNNGFDFNLPYNDTTVGEFFPQFPSLAIGSNDFVTTDENGNFTVNGSPVRFFGANLTTQAAFPTKSDAVLIAGRMRKYGINLIRFHHIDNPWSNGSLFYNITGTRDFNQSLLDRLDYFIYQLKRNGIYVNMNLNVSRTFEEVDGVVDASLLSDYGKGITQYDSVMIALQKEYAMKLLGHVNPYTGIPLAEDPVLAMVEIINENSLFRMWYSDALKPIDEGGKLPVYYNDILDSLWLGFLKNKYMSDAELETAWNLNLIQGDTIYKDGFEDGLDNKWVLELHETAAATAEITSEAASGTSAALINVTSTSSQTWHTQFKFTGESVKKDTVYEIVFKARTDVPKQISLSVQRDNSPWTYYYGSNFSLDTLYKEYSLSFKAPEDNTGYLRISFSFQNQTGQFFLDDFVFKKVSNNGLLEEESLALENVKRISPAEIQSFTKERLMDQTEFYTAIQVDFLAEMRAFLRDSLNVSAPLTGTNWFTGPEDVYVQNTSMDYIDNHAYWDHPNFPNEPWSSTDWTINNTPMLTSASGTIENIFSGMIVKGKPYTISEYNHAFPNQYQSELFPLITSYLSSNDADGLMIFTYSGSWNWSPDKVDGYFDIHRNTSLMGSYPLFSYVFRNFMIQPQSSVLEIAYSMNDILTMPLTINNWWEAHYPYDKKLGYEERIEISFENSNDFDPGILPELPQSPYKLADNQVYWDKSGLLKINTPKFSSICGYLNNFSGTTTDMMNLVSGSDFGSVNWLSLTDSALDVSSRSILNIGTKMMNTNMVWDGTTTVHNSWGISPALVYPLQLELKLKSEYPWLAFIPLDEYGNRMDQVPYYSERGTDGFVTITLEQSIDQTIWYGIEGLDEDPYLGYNEENETSAAIGIFPNPSSGEFRIKTDQKVEMLKVFNMDGKCIYQSTGKPYFFLEQKGIFVLYLKTNNTSAYRKIIVR